MNLKHELETDYLVVGCGAAGMAFTDEILTHSEATVTIVDRRHAPGGHWIDAYPFVRLHQPSAFYGVGSTPLGDDTIDSSGLNAGFYELAGPDEICAYYDRVMQRRFLPSGRVRYFPSCDYQGENRFVSRLARASWVVNVRRRLIDTTYLEGTFPATTPPPFEVAEGAHCIPVGDLTRLTEAPARYVVVGAGKTAMDACVWLLESGVDPASICWIKPREAWWLNRKFQQPHELLADLYVGAAAQLEAMAEATSIDDLFRRLEDVGFFLRVDPDVTPTMFRAAIISEAELALLRQIKNVVRLGRVQRIERDAIVLDDGRIPTTEDTIHVHCAAKALAVRPPKPVFEPGRATLQPIRWGFAPFQAALVGFLEATIEDDDEKNQLCPTVGHPDQVEDFLSVFLTSMKGDRARTAQPRVNEWVRTSRLNPGSGVRKQLDNPRIGEAHQRIKTFAGRAAINLQRLVAG